MRRTGLYILGAILLAGALSAAVSVATVRWLYPQPFRVTSGTTVPEKGPVGATQPGTAPTPAAEPRAVPLPAPPAPGQEEQTAMELIRLAGSGDLPGALALTKGFTEQDLRYQVTRHTAFPRQASRLPGAGQAVTVLLWADYRLEGLPARGHYEVTLQGGKITALKGPLAPEKGYLPFSAPVLDEQGNAVDLAAYSGRGLLLVTPRVPEPELAGLMATLHSAYAGKGIEVVLATDIRSPDWVGAARQAGFKGQVWRVKLRMEDIPLVSRGTFMGAYGVLIDRSGYAVGSLAALDPLRYNLADRTVTDIAPAVFQAYGLLP